MLTDLEHVGLRTRPLITVVTVVYNGVNSIESTIKSFLEQDRSDCEYVVVDGASTDGTREILHKYRDKIDHYISEPDKGVYDAMNKGLALAQGRWIYYLNCGDLFVDPEVLQKASAFLQSTSAPIVVGFVLVNDADVSNKRFPLSGSEEISARSLFRRCFCHQALFITREAYLAHGGFDPSYPTFADFDMCWKIISATGRFETLDLDVAHFDLNGISSDYRRSLCLYKESERIFANAGEERSLLRYWMGAARAAAYKYKRMLIEKFK